MVFPDESHAWELRDEPETPLGWALLGVAAMSPRPSRMLMETAMRVQDLRANEPRLGSVIGPTRELLTTEATPDSVVVRAQAAEEGGVRPKLRRARQALRMVIGSPHGCLTRIPRARCECDRPELGGHDSRTTLLPASLTLRFGSEPFDQLVGSLYRARPSEGDLGSHCEVRTRIQVRP